MAPPSGTVRLGRLAGVEIRFHWSWIMLAGLLLVGFLGQLRSTHPELSDPASFGLALVGATIFVSSVVLHELAHAVMARRRGIEVKGITLYLFGGATEADASSRAPADELLIAIVGPLTSLGLAAILGLLAVGLGTGTAVPDLLGYLAIINVALAAFNLVPGLPLDGGRVVRAIAWGITGDFQRATRWATAAGVAVGYGLVGFGAVALVQGAIGGLWLIGIGWMIGRSATETGRTEQLRSTFATLTAADVMTTPVVAIPAGTSVASAVRDYFAHGGQTAYPIVESDRPIGLLTATDVRQVSPEMIERTSVDQLARPHLPALMAEPATSMLEVIDALAVAASQATKARVLVVDQGRLVGIISPADVIRRQVLDDLIGPSGDRESRGSGHPRNRGQRPRLPSEERHADR